MPSDIQILGKGFNQDKYVVADVRELTRASAQLVALVNASGDIVNPGGIVEDVDVRNLNPAQDTVNVVGVVGITGDVNVIVDVGDKMTIGAITAPVGVSGDVSTTPKSGQAWPVTQSGSWSIAGSGDNSIVDGANRSIKATVRDYANSNPFAVVLTNPSGDAYNSSPIPPPLETKAGTASWSGSYVVASAAAGKRLYITSYDLQAQNDFGYSHFAAGASGAQLTPQWIFGAREGVAKQVPNYGSGYLFRTAPGGNLSLENGGNNVRFSVSYFSGDV